MKALLLTIILSMSLIAQSSEEHNYTRLDSLLLANEFQKALSVANEFNSDAYISMIHGILHIETFSSNELKSFYAKYLERGGDFQLKNVSEFSVKAFQQFVDAFSKANYTVGVQNYKLAAFYKNKYQEEKLSLLLANVENVKILMTEDKYEEANELILDCDAIEEILKSNPNYNNDVYEYEKFKKAYMISERQSKIRTDFDYVNSSDKVFSARLTISLVPNAGASGKMTEFYNGEQKIFTGSKITYLYEYKPKIASILDFGVMWKIYKDLRIGAFYNFYTYLDGKEIDFEVELFVPKYPQYSTVLNPQPTYHKINGNGVKFTIDYSFFKDYIIHPIIGFEYYYGKVSYRGPLGLLREEYPLFFYDKAAFNDEIYSGLDFKIGAEIFYGKQSNLFLDLNSQISLVNRKLSIHQKGSTIGISFGYYIF